MSFIKDQWRKIMGQDAIDLLRADHKEVEQLFQQFESAKDEEQKQEIVRTACMDLIVHTQIEEDLFYPAVRQAIDAKDLMDEAEVEHASAKQLIAELGQMTPRDDLYGAKFTVLAEYVRHHVKEEENEMFPKVQKTDLDLDALGEEMALLKQDLKQDLERRGRSKRKTSKKRESARASAH